MLSVSIIIHAHNAAMLLERTLPLILQQDYPCFEVVAVVDNCTDATLERVKQEELRWPSLRHIEVPRSARHPDRYGLAMMLGVRSARYDWVLMLQPDFAPVSTLWLSRMAQGGGQGTIRAVGYTTIDRGGLEQYLYAHEQMLTMLFRRPAAENSNVLVQRDVWLEGVTQPTVCVRHSEARVQRSQSDSTLWWEVFLRAVRRYNSASPFAYRLLHAVSLWLPLVFLAASVATGVLTWWWLGLAVYLLWFIVYTTLLFCFCRGVGERRFWFSHCLYSLVLPFLLWR